MRIQPEIEHLAVPIDVVTPHPRNVRQGDIGLIAQSLTTNGQYRPIIVQSGTNLIVAGNHTWHAAKSVGADRIAVQYINVTDDQALRIMLADNKANDAATYDDSELLQLLTDLLASDDGLSGTLFDGDDLDDLTALLAAPSLDDVIDELGVHDGTDGFSATIKVTVNIDTYEQWQQLWERQEGDDNTRMARIIELARN